jgi:peptidoglycan hydrolase-like protein with peptidoglycan-binding domain
LNRRKVFNAKSSSDSKIREERAMRLLILALSILGILAGADAANAGLSTITRDPSASIDQATLGDEATQEQATQETEDRIGLDKRKRRDVQRRLTGLGFDTKVNGRFDEQTRTVITRWQAARGYPGTGFLNPGQRQVLLTESASAAHAGISGSDKSDDGGPARRRGGAHHQHSGGGPGGLVGGVVGELFGRR